VKKLLLNIWHFILIYIWQFPQEVVGYIMSRLWKGRLKEINDHDIQQIKRMEEFLNRKIYIVTHVSKQEDKILKWLSGFSICRYICLTDIHDLETIRHENGHCKQSEILGPLYLPLVGVYSAVGCNLWDRWFHKLWCAYDRHYWYYKTRITEKSADKRGNVNRDKILARMERPSNARYPAIAA